MLCAIHKISTQKKLKLMQKQREKKIIHWQKKTIYIKVREVVKISSGPMPRVSY